MTDRRCKLGLRGRLELVRRIESGASQRQAARALGVSPATANTLWRRWCAASEVERQSASCLQPRKPVPKSCPWALSSVDEQRILDARAKTNWGPMRLTWLTGRHRSTCWKVLKRHGVSRQRRSASRQTTRRYEWTEAGALLHIDAFELPKFDRPGHWDTPTAPSATAPAARAKSKSSESSTTTPAWRTARSIPAKPPTPSHAPCAAPAPGFAIKAAAPCKRS